MLESTELNHAQHIALASLIWLPSENAFNQPFPLAPSEVRQVLQALLFFDFLTEGV